MTFIFSPITCSYVLVVLGLIRSPLKWIPWMRAPIMVLPSLLPIGRHHRRALSIASHRVTQLTLRAVSSIRRVNVYHPWLHFNLSRYVENTRAYPNTRMWVSVRMNVYLNNLECSRLSAFVCQNLKLSWIACRIFPYRFLQNWRAQISTT